MKKLLFILYFVFLVGLTLFSYLFIDQNFLYLKNIYSGFSFDHRVIPTVIYISFILIFFLFYISFAILAKKNALAKKDLKLLIILTTIILFLSYPAMLSYDIFNYIFTAKVTYFYKENPYIVMPIEFIGDPLLLFTHAANKIALYGPFWTILTGIPYILGFGNFLVVLFNLKFFVGIFYLLSVTNIFKLTKNLFYTLIFALNPLIVIETLLSGHNDIVMMFFALFSLSLLKNKKLGLAFAFLFLSILIKYSTVFLIPVFLYTSYKVFKKEAIDWNKIFFICFLSMFVIFLLSFIREEIYPWYGIWFLVFAFLTKRNFFIKLSIILSFGLLLRYIPFMLLGTHSGLTPMLKTFLMSIPPFLYLFYVLIKKLWLRTHIS